MFYIESSMCAKHKYRIMRSNKKGAEQIIMSVNTHNEIRILCMKMMNYYM